MLCTWLEILLALLSRIGVDSGVVGVMEELTGPQVAERLGISEGSVRQHLARAKQTLRRLIGG